MTRISEEEIEAVMALYNEREDIWDWDIGETKSTRLHDVSDKAIPIITQLLADLTAAQAENKKVWNEGCDAAAQLIMDEWAEPNSSMAAHAIRALKRKENDNG